LLLTWIWPKLFFYLAQLRGGWWGIVSEGEGGMSRILRACRITLSLLLIMFIVIAYLIRI
jgi:hypothetical protein